MSLVILMIIQSLYVFIIRSLMMLLYLDWMQWRRRMYVYPSHCDTSIVGGLDETWFVSSFCESMVEKVCVVGRNSVSCFFTLSPSVDSAMSSSVDGTMSSSVDGAMLTSCVEISGFWRLFDVECRSWSCMNFSTKCNYSSILLDDCCWFDSAWVWLSWW